jgi:beta-1,4-mannosyl-glycoprotein beta-1,4-N-acetylglucosaminyltransferase
MVLLIDTFMYNGDPIAYKRIEYLQDIVDLFIVVESRQTFSGKHREPSQMIGHPKVKHIILDELNGNSSWERERYQRDFAVNDLMKLPDQYILICSDVDEIPNKTLFNDIDRMYSMLKTMVMHMRMVMFYYNTNWVKPYWWCKGFLCSDQVINKDSSLDATRTSIPRVIIPNGGWHFSYFMSTDDIIRKLESFSHTEYDKPEYKDPKHIENCVNNGIDLFNRGENENLKQSDKINYPDIFKNNT